MQITKNTTTSADVPIKSILTNEHGGVLNSPYSWCEDGWYEETSFQKDRVANITYGRLTLFTIREERSHISNTCTNDLIKFKEIDPPKELRLIW